VPLIPKPWGAEKRHTIFFNLICHYHKITIILFNNSILPPSHLLKTPNKHPLILS
jgi:hypothetical protein